MATELSTFAEDPQLATGRPRLFSDVTTAKVPDQEEVNSLLTLAETLQKNVDYADLQLTKWRFTANVSTIFLPLLALGVIFNTLTKSVPVGHTTGQVFFDLRWFLVSIVALFLYSAFSLNTLSRSLEKWKKLRNSEQRSLGQVVEFLREIEPLISQQLGWSSVARVEFRIRLSRFDIYSEK